MRLMIVLMFVLSPYSVSIDLTPPARMVFVVDFAEATDCSTLGGSGHASNPRPSWVAPNFRPASDNFCRRAP